MTKITLIKNYRQTETLRVLELTDIVEMIVGNEYRHTVDEPFVVYILCST